MIQNTEYLNETSNQFYYSVETTDWIKYIRNNIRNSCHHIFLLFIQLLFMKLTKPS